MTEADVEVAGGMSGERIGTDSLQPTPATLPNVPGKRSITQGNFERDLNIQYRNKNALERLWSRYPVPAGASGAPGFVDQSPMPVRLSPW